MSSEQPTEQQKATARELRQRAIRLDQIIWLKDDYGGEYSGHALPLEKLDGAKHAVEREFGRRLRHAVEHTADRIVVIEGWDYDLDGYILRDGAFHYVCSYSTGHGFPRGIGYCSTHNKPVPRSC